MKIPFFPRKNRGVQVVRFDPTRGLTRTSTRTPSVSVAVLLPCPAVYKYCTALVYNVHCTVSLTCTGATQYKYVGQIVLVSLRTFLGTTRCSTCTVQVQYSYLGCGYCELVSTPSPPQNLFLECRMQTVVSARLHRNGRCKWDLQCRLPLRTSIYNSTIC